MYKDMVSILKEGKVGNMSLEKFEIDKNNYRAMMQGIPIGKYIKLINNKTNEVIMSDTPYEKNSNINFCRNAHGNVLIGGLGIGMIVLAIQDKEDVNSIVIVEKSKDVIDLVATQLPLNHKVKIIQADVFEWTPPKNTLYNCIYMDIWNYLNSDIYDKYMLPLYEKYEKYLLNEDEDPNVFMDCWGEDEIKRHLGI